jgi:regulator of cell morphogenesis and NO signaling
MNENSLGERLVGSIVADDFRTAEVFKKAGIDFCCGGNKSLSETCRLSGIDQEKLEAEITGLASLPSDPARNYKDWDLGFLCDYIMNTHHKFVLRNLPQLVTYTEKIASVHGEHHPELVEVAGLFSRINKELLQHLAKEEEVLFPAIREALAGGNPEACATIQSEISRMSGEHEVAGGLMDKINVITGGYFVPDDGCNTYKVTFKLLEQFEDDLHVHVHLENNILYAKALKIS